MCAKTCNKLRDILEYTQKYAKSGFLADLHARCQRKFEDVPIVIPPPLYAPLIRALLEIVLPRAREYKGLGGLQTFETPLQVKSAASAVEIG